MRIFRSTFLFILATSAICSELAHADYEFNKYEPKNRSEKPRVRKKQSSTPSKKQKTVSDKRVVTRNLKGIIINCGVDDPPSHVLKTTKGVEFYNVANSSHANRKSRDKFKKKLSRYAIGKSLTFDKIKKINAMVNEYYQENGQALVVVSIPEQELEEQNTVLVINVLESRASKIEIKGNRYTPDERIEEYSTLQTGDVIYNSVVERDAHFMSHSPWRKVEVEYSAGDKPGTTDVTYNVRDERPFRVYAGSDDTGFNVTDIFRVFFGFNWGNFLNQDQILSYQYTASPDFKKFQAHMASYTIPLPNKNLLVFFGGYSLIQVSDESIPANVHRGQSWQVSGRYDYPFYPKGMWLQNVKAGIDYKRTNNDLVVGEQVLGGAYATVFQYMASYETSFEWDTSTIEGTIEGFIQPFTFGSGMSSGNYDVLRPGADTRYAYLKSGMKYNYNWAKLQTDFNLRAVLQLSTGTLIPLEQLGMGGFYSVRGYPERAVNVDNGLIVNFEVRSPKMSLFHRKDKKPVDALSGVGFFDFALGGNTKRVPDEPYFWGLAGLGPGLRYDYSAYLHTRLDMGIRLPSTPFGSDSPARVRWYFSVVGAY